MSFSITTVRNDDGTGVIEIKPDSDKCIKLIFTTAVIIDVITTVLVQKALLKCDPHTSKILCDTFSHNSLTTPLNLWAERHLWLPLRGSDGFTSIGVSLFLLLFVEAIPKSLALRNPEKFVILAGWAIAPVYLTRAVPALSANIDQLAELIIRVVKAFVSRLCLRKQQTT